MASLSVAAAGKLAKLGDVDVEADDGLTNAARLTYDEQAGLWTPKLPAPLEAQRASGPANDTLKVYTGFTDGRATGEGSYDGALWSIADSGITNQAVMGRVDVGPDGLTETIGTTILRNDGGFDSINYGKRIASTTKGLYVETVVSGQSIFQRVDTVDTFVTLAPPTPAVTQAIVGVGEDVYRIGRDAAGDPQALRYDAWADTWSAIATPPFETSGAVEAVRFGSEIITFGGNDTAGDDQDVWRYSPLLDTWTQLNLAPDAVDADQLHAVQFGSLIYAANPQSTGDGLSPLHFYSPELDAWERSLADGVLAISGAVAAVGNRILWWAGTSIIVYG